MRVLHAPVNIAGQPYTFVRALRALGVDAELLVFKERPFVRGYDRTLHLERYPSRLRKWLRVMRAFVQAATRYDVFHFHTNMTLLYPFRWDLPILRTLGKKIVFQFWGSEIRGRDPSTLSYLRYADAVIVGSYHMLAHAPPGAHVVLPGLDLSRWPVTPSDRFDGPVRIVHAPSSRAVKGTAHVLAAADRLRQRGVPFELELVEGVPHAEAVRIYERSDIAVDQLAAGWYGIFALEAMALGKVVMGHIDPEKAELLERARGLRPAVVGISAATLAETLERFIGEPELRADRARMGRGYVEQLHDIRASAAQVMQIYRLLGE
jgi:glycosyltransferase involved in cell wall biosynthesis